MEEEIPDVLASRYASQAMKALWSPKGRILCERELWIAVLKAQQELGVPVKTGAIEAYERVKGKIDLASIAKRERVNHHDVKARIDEFCDLAGFQEIHKGMTSRDLTENTEQLQILSSLKLLREKAVAALYRLSLAAEKGKSLMITARTHNAAAQPTTWGKRLAMFGQEILSALTPLDSFIRHYAVKGIQGAVGTQLDLITLFNGDQNKVAAFHRAIGRYLGVETALNAVGQIYPRSLDFQAASTVSALCSGPGSFATTLRLMAGFETASEGFSKGQVGSSAMPHKMNSRSCERIQSLRVIVNGFLSMLNEISGTQWNEGDVSCSAVRRVALPGLFYAADGIYETFLTILDQMQLFPAVIEQENEHYFPFLCTTTLLMEAVKKGAGRETAHEAIKEHAVQTVLELREGRLKKNNLLERLAADSRLGLSLPELEAVLSHGEALTGDAERQVERFREAVDAWCTRFPEAIATAPEAIL